MNFFEKLFEKLLRKKEVERVFILEGKELPLIKEKLKALGFKKKLNATQVSRYFDFDDSRLFKAQQYLRIRAISDKYKYTTSVEFALNIRRIDANKSEVRDQFKLNLTIEEAKVMEQILLNLGFIVLFNFSTNRTEYGLEFEVDFREDIHVEIDEDISFYDKGEITCNLENTVQLCVETNNLLKANIKINDLVDHLGLDNQKITIENYFERFFKKEKENSENE